LVMTALRQLVKKSLKPKRQLAASIGTFRICSFFLDTT